KTAAAPSPAQAFSAPAAKPLSADRRHTTAHNPEAIDTASAGQTGDDVSGPVQKTCCDRGEQADHAGGDEHPHERGGGHQKRRQPDADEPPEQFCAVDEAEVSYGVALAEVVGHQAC